jgi:hypothetical protein
MLLKKIDENNIIKCWYDSSNILHSIFDKNENTLTIYFNKGFYYVYPNVEYSDYVRFETSESQGKTFNQLFKNAEYLKKEIYDSIQLQNEVNDIINEEKLVILKDIVNHMKILIEEFENGNGFLKNLMETIIDKWEKNKNFIEK